MIVNLPPNGNADAAFGCGMNMITGSLATQKCVSGAGTPGAPVTIGADTTNYLVVQDAASFSNALSTAASMSASGVGWSASATVSYLREQTGNSTSISLVWMRAIQSQSINVDMSKAVIAQAALDVLTKQGPLAFVEAYGTHCVIGVAYGGTFVGRFRLDTASATDKESIAAAIHGSITEFGVSGTVSASFENDLNSSSSHYSASLEAQATGSGTIDYASFDLAGAEAALRGFTLRHDATRNVDGSPFAFICQTWDQFPQIAAALAAMGTPTALQFTAEMASLQALSNEFAALESIRATANHLAAAGTYAVPAYQTLLIQMAETASAHQASIQSLTMTAIARLTAQSIMPYLVSPKMTGLLDAIAHGHVLVTISYALDWAFGSPSQTLNLVCAIDNVEHQLADYVHQRPEGDDPPQHMTLYYTLSRDQGGTAWLSTRMHWRDPYGPPNDVDFRGGPVQLGPGFPVGTATASWGQFPWNNMSATLTGLDPSLVALAAVMQEKVMEPPVMIDVKISA